MCSNITAGLTSTHQDHDPVASKKLMPINMRFAETRKHLLEDCMSHVQKKNRKHADVTVQNVLHVTKIMVRGICSVLNAVIFILYDSLAFTGDDDSSATISTYNR